MINNVVSLDDRRPHITIADANGDYHVIPLSTFHGIIDGKMKASRLDDFELIVPRIIQEWLEHVESI